MSGLPMLEMWLGMSGRSGPDFDLPQDVMAGLFVLLLDIC